MDAYLLEERLEQTRTLWTSGQMNEAQAVDRETIREYEAEAEDDDPFRLTRPRLAEAYKRIGVFAKDRGNYEDARRRFQTALECDPGDAEAHLDLGFLQLLLGEFANGWREHEWRWEARRNGYPNWLNHVPDEDNYPRPNVTVAQFNGRRVALYGEQGRGDQIQFVRYARLVHDAGAEVVVRCRPCMVRLFRTCPGVHSTYDSDEAVANADIHLPFMSLPLLFGSKRPR